MNLRVMARLLLLLLAVFVSIFAMFHNGELKDVEWSLFLAAGAVLLFHADTKALFLRRLYVAFLCTSSSPICTSVPNASGCSASVRTLSSNGAIHNTSPGHPFFRDMLASSRFHTVLAELSDALRENPRPVFLGPRLEFAYAAYHLPSPLHLPVWWHPGTSFAVAQELAVLAAWQDDRFSTLIFLKDDFTYYTPRFLALIQRSYLRDDHFSQLTIFHLRHPITTR